MKQQITDAIEYIKAHKQQFGTGTIAAIGVVVLTALFIYNQPVTYAATNACELFTPSKAMDTLGDQVIQTGNSKAATNGDVATSKCGYTDKNEDPSKKLIATLAVQSAVNDDGIASTKQTFDAHKEALGDSAQPVSELGARAYYETTTGVLNVLQEKRWVKVLYGVGEGPTSQPLEDVVALARAILK